MTEWYAWQAFTDDQWLPLTARPYDSLEAALQASSQIRSWGDKCKLPTRLAKFTATETMITFTPREDEP